MKLIEKEAPFYSWKISWKQEKEISDLDKIVDYIDSNNRKDWIFSQFPDFSQDHEEARASVIYPALVRAQKSRVLRKEIDEEADFEDLGEGSIQTKTNEIPIRLWKEVDNTRKVLGITFYVASGIKDEPLEVKIESMIIRVGINTRSRNGTQWELYDSHIGTKEHQCLGTSMVGSWKRRYGQKLNENLHNLKDTYQLRGWEFKL